MSSRAMADGIAAGRRVDDHADPVSQANRTVSEQIHHHPGAGDRAHVLGHDDQPDGRPDDDRTRPQRIPDLGVLRAGAVRLMAADAAAPCGAQHRRGRPVPDRRRLRVARVRAGRAHDWHRRPVDAAVRGDLFVQSGVSGQVEPRHRPGGADVRAVRDGRRVLHSRRVVQRTGAERLMACAGRPRMPGLPVSRRDDAGSDHAERRAQGDPAFAGVDHHVPGDRVQHGVFGAVLWRDCQWCCGDRINAFSSPFTHTRRAVLSILIPLISTISFCCALLPTNL